MNGRRIVMKTVNSILVVGGGTAGLIAAIILKIKLNLQIDIVHSKNIGIIGVGEGSTEHWKEFMNYAGIDQYELIKETDATYKCGIMFQNWSEKDYLHCVAGPFDSKTAQYHYVYAKQISENKNLLNPVTFWENKIDSRFFNNSEIFPANQFHFNTQKLNDFLIKKAKMLGIIVYEDDITDVCLKEDGYINYCQGKKQNYKYDFYIDSTGFKKLLIEKLGGKWKSFSDYLKMKSAIVFQTEDEEEYNFWTTSRALDYGWLFRIPVWGRHGNGYIFDSDYISADEAHCEIEKLFHKTIKINKQFNFDPGCLENCWIKNCCAIGLSASFVEPLEASSIGTSIQQSFLLMHRITQYDDNVIKKYNKSINDIMENIRDFICLHYITKKNNTNFWKDLKNINLPDSLKNNLEVWKNKLPINEDFNHLSDYILFKDSNFILVMQGLELFNTESIKREYYNLNQTIRDHANFIVNNHSYLDQQLKTLSHKKFIELIRTYT